MRRVLFVSAGIVAALSLTLASFAFFAGRANAASGSSTHSFVHACSQPQHGFAACHAIVDTGVAAAASTPSEDRMARNRSEWRQWRRGSC